MRSSTSTGGFYESIVANLSDSDVVRCHPFGFVKAPQDFCIVPLVRLDGLRQSMGLM
jgi:hypothetical protein